MTTTSAAAAPAVPVTGRAAQADAVADSCGWRATSLLSAEARGASGKGKCGWTLVTLAQLGSAERDALAWIIADVIVKTRGGKSSTHDQWRAAAIAETPLTGTAREKLLAFLRPVFGTPEAPGPDDHVEGHVAEWLWYLLITERDEPHRQAALVDPPKFAVTEPGPDGFVVYEINGVPTIFRLWEIKKHVATSTVSATVGKAYDQLRRDGSKYLAQLTAIHSDESGALGDLCAQLVDLWVDGDPRAGAGVGIASGALPPPQRCFTTMGKRLPDFREPGQLEGLLCALEDYHELARQVREFVWSPL